ncbi:hypothetical protein V6N12_028409 [Hibiscus sabdariffa]|uniref:Uncharacterized protein n=1 Tax=Hibiscus sabdariffa TaxID=183260 RepID=A0ABR2F5S3_9ROSI
MAENLTIQHSLSPSGRPPDIAPSAADNYAMNEDHAGVKLGLCPEGLMDLGASNQVLPIPSSMAVNVEIPANGVITDVVAVKPSFHDMIRGQNVQGRRRRQGSLPKSDNRGRNVNPSNTGSRFSVLDNVKGEISRPMDLVGRKQAVSNNGNHQEMRVAAVEATVLTTQPIRGMNPLRLEDSVATSQLEKSAPAVVGVQRPIVSEVTTPAATMIQSFDAVVTETLDVVKDMNATVNISVVASTARVITAPSVLLVAKHTTIRVVDDGLKRSVKDPVGSSMCGSIRKSSSKGAGRNNPLMNGVQRKTGKPKKQVGIVSTKVGVAKWVNDMARELTSGISSTGPRISEPLSDISNDRYGVQWIAKSTFEGERHDAS